MEKGRSKNAWTLQSFVDSLVYELDKARNTLAVKGINKPMSYAVKDLSVDLQVFPEYDGDEVKFVNVKPGESGFSRISFQLGSITDRQIRETSKQLADEDLSIDEVEMEPEIKKELKKIGVESVKDFQRIRENNVKEDVSGSGKLNFNDLASKIEKAKRAKKSPSVSKAIISESFGVPVLHIRGENLSISEDFKPIVFFGNRKAEVLSYSDSNLQIRLTNEDIRKENSTQLTMFLDPYAIVKLNVK